MANMKQHKLGWIGIGRMGYAMAERLAKAGCDITVWNRTKSKAEPLAKSGAKVADNLTDLAGCDIVFTMVSTGKDVKEVLFGPNGVMSKGGKPKIIVDSTSISLEESAEIRAKLGEKGTVTYLFEGALMHRDSLGFVQRITPGDVNWMTAGHGIVHSERSPDDERDSARTLHGIQVWIALPAADEQTEPAFTRHPQALRKLRRGGRT